MIRVAALTRRFGERVAVDGISFEVQRGEVLGFLGPNGAGKTTTMRILTGYLPATSGTAEIAGFDVFRHPLEVKRRIGYLPENPPVYPEMRVETFVSFVAELHALRRSLRASKVDAALERCGLGSVRRRLIGNLSKGYRQRVGLAAALVHDPEVLILDEPTVGLDPAQIIEIRNLIRSFADSHTVILSTHILPEVEATCGRVAIIRDGRLVVDAPLLELTQGNRLQVRVVRDAAEVAGRLAALPGVAEVTAGEPGLYRIKVVPGGDPREAIAACVAAAGWGLLLLSPPVAALEQVYLGAVAGASEREAA